MKIKYTERYLNKAVHSFAKDPEESGKKLGRLIHQEGYETVSHIFPAMLDAYHEDPMSWKVLCLLLQPDWTWRKTGDPNRAFFGVVIDEQFVLMGYYYLNSLEDGCVNIIPRAEYQEQYTEEIQDPRFSYRDTKYKIYRKNAAHYLVEAGRIVDLINKGYERASLILTQGKGYLKRFTAYAVVSEHKDVEEAREAKTRKSA
jgi:hypothetical protein